MKKIINCIDNSAVGKFKQRIPLPNETLEETEEAELLYEADFLMAESLSSVYCLVWKLQK